ncbi:MAG: hypothetical protein COZ06_02305 [Armatimonadetes bacterium CG_4_10_14_3_um_filter_66_18]|nr:ATP-dependent Clp protease ATP-binding subunit [Armatimonadota bacterium]OIP06044.1 MAG: hypothetical protein AUJ96_09710 [Armatimonadetes bacterium CG2_30_66_41]PIU95681.1 MAG: hypothetical protein COS65_01270 [Armatimonadetes bacterium CG06_land_8_20_14_3_00_66_21]PIY52961.1 MAG: hypothetical protein COZ06_02305 [Armatimonadetes bacterium CG_4_10_14_3_um_filter_66_18]PIZ41234.1 MAG: hypothetical protein COY42_19695 [Armatimonadetes bacterium CG_4_10_14_0_8_um_filter_66_14]PJB63379.1 MAG: 
MNALTLEQDVVLDVLSHMTGVPKSSIRAAGPVGAGIDEIEAHLRGTLIAQETAIGCIVQSLKSRLLRGAEERPVFCGLFVGPSGVGKTEAALQLAEAFAGTRDALVRVDGSEYREPHTVARLVGSPPGYVGYGEGGYLTEAVRRRRRCVVLFDEVEKAAAEVQNTLLQVMSAGHLTDATGRRVDFRHAVLILTSNIGNREATAAATVGGEMDHDLYEQKIRLAVREQFPLELLGRLDAVVVFRHLDRAALCEIVTLKVRELAHRLKGVAGIELSEAACTALAEEAYQPDAGAREVDRVLRERVDRGFLALMERGSLATQTEQVVAIDVDPDGNFTFRTPAE